MRENVIVFTAEEKANAAIRAMLKNVVPAKCLHSFTDPIEALAYAAEEKDLLGLLVDVDCSSCDDLRLVKIVRALKRDALLVFLSRSGRYAREAFEYDALDYLLLPPQRQKVREAVDKMRERRRQNENGGVFIKTFGAFEVIVGGRVVPWKNSKPKELLAFLVDSRGDSVSSEKIQKTLWPDADSAKAAATYHTTLHQLRKKLAANGIPGLLVGSRGSQRVNTEAFTCDFYQFEQEVESGTVEAGKRAFDLYKGRYLENNSYKWSGFTRVRLEMQFEQILQRI